MNLPLEVPARVRLPLFEPLIRGIKHSLTAWDTTHFRGGRLEHLDQAAICHRCRHRQVYMHRHLMKIDAHTVSRACTGSIVMVLGALLLMQAASLHLPKSEVPTNDFPSVCMWMSYLSEIYLMTGEPESTDEEVLVQIPHFQQARIWVADASLNLNFRST